MNYFFTIFQILKNNSPLLVPILLGWERQLTKHKTQNRR